MKKHITIALALIAAISSVSCQKALEPSPAAGTQGLKQVTMSVNTPAGDFTKGTLDGLTVKWNEGEGIAVYDGIDDTARKFTVVSVDGSSATISGEIAEESTSITAVYPYSAALGFAEGKVTVSMPVGQVIPEGGCIDPSVLVSVASAEIGADITFRNVVSLIKFTVGEEGAVSVLFVSNGSEKFFGTASVDPSTMEVTGASTNRGKVSAAQGTTFVKDAVYYAACYPCELAQGLNVTTAMADKKYYKSSEKPNAFVRNSGLNLGNLVSSTVLPMVITNKTELYTWAQYASCYVKGETVKLGADINCEGADWTPVPGYVASLDGQGYSIYNLKIVPSTVDPSCIGFFSVLRHTNTIKDLALGKDPSTGLYDGTSTLNIINAQYSGGLTALIKADTASDVVTISGVSNYIPLVRQASATNTDGLRIGGIVGATSDNCVNVTTITGCYNYGAIDNLATTTNGASNYAGILGYCAGASTVITDCHNEGDICLGGAGKLSSASFAGGILGRLNDTASCTITGCTNAGKIYTRANVSSAMPYLGGIAGADKTTAKEFSLKIKDCKNSGTISAYNQSKGTIAGGILALLQTKTTIEDCENTGEVYKAGNHGSTSIFGGIVGKTEEVEGARITRCKNSGKVYEREQTSTKIIVFGGIAGTCQIPVIDCTNTGNIVATGNKSGINEYLGGIAGLHCATDLTGGSSPIEGCKAACTIKISSTLDDSGAIGGLIGCQGESACTTGEGCSVDCIFKGSALPAITGIIVGNYGSAGTATTFGSTDSKIKVKGTFNGTTIDATNFASMLEGTSTASAGHVFNAEFAE